MQVGRAWGGPGTSLIISTVCGPSARAPGTCTQSRPPPPGALRPPLYTGSQMPWHHQLSQAMTPSSLTISPLSLGLFLTSRLNGPCITPTHIPCCCPGGLRLSSLDHTGQGDSFINLHVGPWRELWVHILTLPHCATLDISPSPSEPQATLSVTCGFQSLWLAE